MKHQYLRALPAHFCSAPALLGCLLLLAWSFQVLAAPRHWVGTWSTSPQLVEPANMPPEPGLSQNTLRQLMRVSLGGDTLRIRFSNEFSTHHVTLRAVSIAASTGAGAIDPATSRKVTFGGAESTTMAPGASAISDPVAFPLKPGMDVAITLFFGETSPDVTGHPGSRTTSYLSSGNRMADSVPVGSIHTDHWYILSGIDVIATEHASSLVVLGNSITDGRGSGTNKQNRWTDILAERLRQNPSTRMTGVLNHGIGGNCVLRSCLGPAALDRFERDVLRQPGGRWLIILEGINDIGQAGPGPAAEKVARDLTAAYETMINKAHAAGIKVYGATLLPFGGSFYDTPDREAARQTVNQWIRTSGRFDAVIDLDLGMRDPGNPRQMLPDIHTGDFLHPNEAGHQRMGTLVDLNLFRTTP